MLIVMGSHATEQDIRAVVEKVESLGLEARPITGAQRTNICVLRNKSAVDTSHFMGMPGVVEAIRVSKPYKLVSRETHPEDTVFEVGGVKVGGRSIVVIAGPCAVEGEKQIFEVAQQVKAAGAHMLRAGAYKPRTSPYSFQGMGEEGLKLLARVRAETGLPIVTEAIDHEVCDLVEQYADVIQIGARNMQNFSLLKRAGRAKIPVLLKRGISATFEEWLMAAEYIMSEGNHRVILCERGVRTFADHLRNTLNLSVVPYAHRITHLPLFVDPSHGAGNRDLVPALSFGAIAVGVHGLIIEVHPDPPKAMSDGAQSMFPKDFSALMDRLPLVAAAVRGRAVGV